MFGILALAITVILSLSAGQKISVEYCFGYQSSLLGNEPSCNEGQQGTLMFDNGHISSFRTTLNSSSLLVVCKSNEPIQIRLNIPNVELYTKSLINSARLVPYTLCNIKTWSETGSFVRQTSEMNVSYVRWIKLESLEIFSGIFRCESTSSSNIWSQLFIAPSTLPPFFHLSSPLNLFIPEITASNSYIVVPCIGAKTSAWGTDELKLYKRSIYHSLYTNELNQDCIASLCHLMDTYVFPIEGPLRNMMGNPPMGDHCREYIKNDTGSVKDVNLDSIVSCVDAIASFPNFKKFIDLQSSHYKEGVARTHAMLNHVGSFQDKEKVRVVDDAVYNGSLGFVVAKASWDYESEYLCSIKPKGLTEKARINQGFIPLDSRKELNVTVEIIGNELYCEINQLTLRNILRKRQTQFWMVDCHSLADCDLQFRPKKGLGQPIVDGIRRDNNVVVNVDADHASSIVSKLSLSLPLDFQNGLVGCTGIFITNGTAPFYARTFRYLFSGIDKRPYFVDENVPINSLIRLTGTIANNTNQLFSCQFPAFHFGSSCIFAVQNADVVMTFDSNDFNMAKKNGGTISTAKLNNASNLWERALSIQLDSGDFQVRCSALQLHAGTWQHAEISIQVPKAPGIFGVGAIVSICLAIFLFLFLVLLAVYLLIKNRQAGALIRTLAPEEIDVFLNGGMKDTQITAESSSSLLDVDKLVFPTDLQINSSSLRVLEGSVLGEGEFGICKRGEWNGMAVAVKIPKPSADLNYFREFLREIKIMGYVGDHRNIVKLYGAVVDNLKRGHCVAVLELSTCGNLLNLLKQYDATSDKAESFYTNAGPSTLPAILTSTHMSSFSLQIAVGMEYLSELKVIHGDLAARNVLMYPDLTLKITDFGLSRKLYDYSTYAKKSAGVMPWRWMAFESLKHFNFSLLSDVWAYGVTIWEIYTLGQTPFGGLRWNEEFLYELEQGQRPAKPAHADEIVYRLMLNCWELSPENRPTMSQVKNLLEDSIKQN